jgi:hypothetical protein
MVTARTLFHHTEGLNISFLTSDAIPVFKGAARLEDALPKLGADLAL